MGKVKKKLIVEDLHSHEILRQNLKRTKKLVTKDGKVKKKTAKQLILHKCYVCSKGFSDKYSLANHEQIHGPALHSCPQCSYSGKTKKYLSRHIKKVHTVPSNFKCKVCGKAYHYQSNLKEHFTIHTGEKPYECEVCGKTFRVSFSLNSHMLIHTDERPYQCKYCEYACRDSSTLRKHENRHLGIVKSHSCSMCNKKFPERAKLKYHINDKHLHHLNLDIKKFVCETCGKAFKANSILVKHVQTVHERAFVCKCPICNKDVSSRSNLPAHLRTHFHERPYRCAHARCGMAFKDKGALKKHAVTHDPTKQHRCEVCGARFARRHRLKAHLNTHRPKEKRVQCHYCNVKFLTKNYLIKHIRWKHSGDQQKFICDICGMTSYNKPGLVVHMKYAHEQKHKCQICNKKFRRYVKLKKHLRISHNTRTEGGKKVAEKPYVQVKVEPRDAESYDELNLLEVVKEEPVEEILEPITDEYVSYSKSVLSEDLSECILNPDAMVSTSFDKFLLDHVFKNKVKTDSEDQESTPDVNEEQKDYVTKQIKEIIKKSETEDKARSLKRKMLQAKKSQISKGKATTSQTEANLLKLKKLLRREKKNELLIKKINKSNREESKLETQHDNDTSDSSDDEVLSLLKAKETNNENNQFENTKIEDGNSIPTVSNELNNQKLQRSEDNVSKSKHVNLESEMLTEQYEEITKTKKKSDSEKPQTENADSAQATSAKEIHISVNNKAMGANETQKKNIQERQKLVVKLSRVDAVKAIRREAECLKITKEQEVRELMRVLKMYNERVRAAAVKESSKKAPSKTIKYFKNKKDLNTNNNNTNAKSNDVANNLIISNTGGDKDIIKRNGDLNVSQKFKNNEERDVNDCEVEEATLQRDNDSIHDDNSLDDDKRADEDPLYNPEGDEENDNTDSEDEGSARKKMTIKSFQCYICFKLYPTKEELINHCEVHFDICSQATLTKCPICNHVTNRKFTQHMRDKHDIYIKLPYSHMKERPNPDGSKYCYDVDGTVMEIIPSTKLLNHNACIKIDRKNREIKDKTIATNKLVKKGKEWIIENVALDVKFNELPEFSKDELLKLDGSDNDVDRLKQLSRLAKKRGIKMVFPCNDCDKICQNFAALKLHGRRHDPNKKPFRPRGYKRIEEKKKTKVDLANRTAKPKPIVHKHKCDEQLKSFYENYIRGGDIEFWQFLKIFNRLERENIKDFKDLEGRSDFGIHTKEDLNIKMPVTKKVRVPVNKTVYKKGVSLNKKKYLKREEAKMQLREKIARETNRSKCTLEII